MKWRESEVSAYAPRGEGKRSVIGKLPESKNLRI
jgi:hypothetical protein